MQRPFGRSGRAGRVDHQRGVIGRSGDRRELRGGARQHRVEILGAVCRPIDRPHEFESGRGVADRWKLREPLRIRDQGPCAGILEAVGDRLEPEQHRQRQRDRAEFVDGNVAHCDGRSLWQEDRDAIALGNPARSKRVGQPIRGLAQCAVTDLLHRAIRTQVKNGSSRRIDPRPAVADVNADIVERRDLPAERAIERAVFARGGKHVGRVHRKRRLVMQVREVYSAAPATRAARRVTCRVKSIACSRISNRAPGPRCPGCRAAAHHFAWASLILPLCRCRRPESARRTRLWRNVDTRLLHSPRCWICAGSLPGIGRLSPYLAP